LASGFDQRAAELELWPVFLHLGNVKGFGWNHKRVYRIYCELELNLRIKHKNRLKRDHLFPLVLDFWTA
jgi:putative transposase